MDNRRRNCHHTIEDRKSEAFSARLVQWNPFDHSGKNANKKKDVFLWQIADDVGVDGLLF